MTIREFIVLLDVVAWPVAAVLALCAAIYLARELLDPRGAAARLRAFGEESDALRQAVEKLAARVDQVEAMREQTLGDRLAELRGLGR